jgi:hypothetical protein
VVNDTILPHTGNLDAHRFSRAFIVHQVPMVMNVGLIEEATARAFVADIEELHANGQLSARFMVQAAVGTK